jgi:hypothetical protein
MEDSMSDSRDPKTERRLLRLEAHMNVHETILLGLPRRIDPQTALGALRDADKVISGLEASSKTSWQVGGAAQRDAFRRFWKGPMSVIRNPVEEPNLPESEDDE